VLDDPVLADVGIPGTTQPAGRFQR
jgi:hypothetical protein